MYRIVILRSLGLETDEGCADLLCLDLGRVGSGRAAGLTLPPLRFLTVVCLSGLDANF